VSQVLGEIFDDRVIAANVAAVRRHATALDGNPRLQYLADWVLPNSTRPEFRMSGEFVPTNVAPNAFHTRPQADLPEGELVSPVFDLIGHAKTLGSLRDLEAEIRGISSEGELQIRARLAMLGLVSLALGESKAAENALNELISMAQSSQPRGLDGMWPETLVAFHGVHNFPRNRTVQALIDILHGQRASQRKPAGIDHWHTRITALYARSNQMRQGATRESFDVPFDSADWLPSTRMTDRTRGLGRAEERWHRNAKNEIHHVNEHDAEYMLYCTPLRGNFELHAEVGYGATQTLLAGHGIGASSRGDLGSSKVEVA
jgi:hypothetical protein